MSGAEAVYILVLMRMKDELNPYDEIRLHKTALFINIFSRNKCFKINDYLVIDFFPEIERLAKLENQLIDSQNTSAEKCFDVFYQSQEQRIKESYQRSIPYILQSANFVNSITDNRTLVLVSALTGLLDSHPQSTIDEIMELLDNHGYYQEFFSRKTVITSITNLVKSNVLRQFDSTYSLRYDYKEVTGYQRLLF